MIITGRSGAKPPLFRGHVPVVHPADAQEFWTPRELGTDLVFAADTNDSGRALANGSLYHLYDTTRYFQQANVNARPGISTTGGAAGDSRIFTFADGDYIQTSASTDATDTIFNGASILTGVGACFIAAQLRPNALTSILLWSTAGSTQYAALQQAATEVNATIFDGGTHAWAARNGQSLDGSWHILGIVKAQDNLMMYIDGQMAGITPLTLPSDPLAFDAMSIGASLSGSTLTATTPLAAMSGLVMTRTVPSAADISNITAWLGWTCGLAAGPDVTISPPIDTGTTPTPTPTPTPVTVPILLTPSTLGTLQTAGGVAIVPVNVRTQSLTQAEWQVQDSKGRGRGPWQILGSADQSVAALTSDSGIDIQAPIVDTGDKVAVRKPTDNSVIALTDAATVTGEVTPLPAIVTDHRSKLFKPVMTKWLYNNQFMELVNTQFDFAATLAHATEGCIGYRSQLTWLRADGFDGYWQPASSPCYRAYRDPSNLNRVWFQAKNQNYIPEVGDDVVFYTQTDDAGSVTSVSGARVTSTNLNGLSLPHFVKLKIAAARKSVSGTPSGSTAVDRTEYAIDFPGGAPAMDIIFRNLTTKVFLWLRHWNFYIDRAQTKARFPLGWLSGTLLDQVIPNGGYVILGGEQGQPTSRDRAAEYRDFGQMFAELETQETQWLGNRFANVPPSKLLIEFENEPSRSWLTSSTGAIGVRDTIINYQYPAFRKAFPDGTLGVKGTSFGSLQSLRDEFDWQVPDGKNTAIVTHNYDGQVDRAGNKLGLYDPADVVYYVSTLKAAALKAKAHNFGMTEYGISPYYFWTVWDNTYKALPDDVRGKALGYMLTEFSRQGGLGFVAGWFRVGDFYNVSDFYTDIVAGKKIQALFPKYRPYASKAGLVSY